MAKCQILREIYNVKDLGYLVIKVLQIQDIFCNDYAD